MTADASRALVAQGPRGHRGAGLTNPADAEGANAVRLAVLPPLAKPPYSHPHAQQCRRYGPSLQAQPGFGWKTPASLARRISEARRNRRRLAAVSRVVQ